MELTKEQIHYIDSRLENEGVKYWDIRIEMLDHVVSDVEKNSKPENSEYEFKEIVQNAFVALGWKENFNGSGFEEVLKENFKNIGRKNRDNYKKEVVSFFKNASLLIIFILLILSYYLLSNFIPHSQFVKVSYILFSIPVLLFFYESIKLWRKKIGKSYNKDLSLSSILFSFGILNIIILSMKTEGGEFALPIEYQKPILFILLPIHLVFSYVGYQTYNKTIVKVVNMRNQLLL